MIYAACVCDLFLLRYFPPEIVRCCFSRLNGRTHKATGSSGSAWLCTPDWPGFAPHSTEECAGIPKTRLPISGALVADAFMCERSAVSLEESVGGIWAAGGRLGAGPIRYATIGDKSCGTGSLRRLRGHLSGSLCICVGNATVRHAMRKSDVHSDALVREARRGRFSHTRIGFTGHLGLFWVGKKIQQMANCAAQRYYKRTFGRVEA
uniref:Uncharacterized protein TCIL3000_6_1150 n=1 Tax=Trypanosoma congolense (strain IL3000) TaxID=1068625 RepID=G0UNC3_TRYCI|nr:unnamed protein product [Trypanosoma congolense IL3000]